MEKNLLLKASLTLMLIARFFVAFAAALILIVWVGAYFNPDSMKTLRLKDEGFSVSTGPIENERDLSIETFITEHPVAFNLTMLEYLIYTMIIFIIIRQIIRVIKSMKSLNTFMMDNVKAFRIIGYSLIVVVFLKSLEFNPISSEVKFTIPFLPIIVCLFSFILAEVFKEGNKLYEENSLTI